jgi:hypothetical protein
MSNVKEKTIRLSDRDLKILRHVRTHGMSTIAAVQAMFFGGQGRDAVKSTLRRLCGQPPDYRYLKPEPLDSHRVYYRLTNRAVRLLGAPKEAARALGPQAKIGRYAVLWFICMDRPGARSLFNPRDFPDQFDIGPNRLPRPNFYIERISDEEHRLGFIIVDHGSHVRRILRKAADTLVRFLRHGWFDAYVRDRAFALTVLTPTAAKKRSILLNLEASVTERLRHPLRRLSMRDTDCPIHLDALVVPQLSNLIVGVNDQP